MRLVRHRYGVITFLSATLAAGALAWALPASAAMNSDAWAKLASTTRPVSSPNQAIKACKFVPEKPFFLTTKSRKMYGSGKITGCTNPPPDKCKLTVDLEAKEPNSFLWHTVASNTTGWVKCKKRTLRTKPFICHASPGKFDFSSFVTLQIEAFGQHNSNSDRSGVEEFFCQG